MTLEELRNRRWGALLRVADSPGQAVSQLAAVQAQDLTMALLAVALRCPGTQELDIRQALDQGRIVRTHAMRPTWHFVAAEDLRWIVGLTGPRVTQVAGPQFAKKIPQPIPSLRETVPDLEEQLVKPCRRTRMLGIVPAINRAL